MQVADPAAGLGDGLALDLQDQPQHAVGGGVLRAHVDHDALTGLGFGGRGGDLIPVLPADDHDSVGARSRSAAVLLRIGGFTHQL